MSQLTPVRTGLDVGFDGQEVPPCFAGLKGPVWRSIPAADEFPFEDSQFEAVVLAGSVVNLTAVREAHRVLRPDGCLYFVVPENRGGRPDGLTMPQVYQLVREGYNIIGVERPKWRWLGLGKSTLTICARKKNWNNLKGATYRPYV